MDECKGKAVTTSVLSPRKPDQGPSSLNAKATPMKISRK